MTRKKVQKKKKKEANENELLLLNCLKMETAMLDVTETEMLDVTETEILDVTETEMLNVTEGFGVVIVKKMSGGFRQVLGDTVHGNEK